MKRIVMLCAILLATGVMAFADIVFWGWGAATWEPLIFNIPEKGDMDVMNAVAAPWRGYMEAQFTVSGNAQYSGFRLRMMAKGLDLRLGDLAYLWVRPQPWVTIFMGRVKDYSMQGQETVTGISRVYTLREADSLLRRAGTIDKAWSIFTPLNPQSWSSAMDLTGVALTFHLLRELYLGAYYNPGAGLAGMGNYAFVDPNGKPGAYQKTQATVGYSFPAIGRFRLQYVGKDVFVERDNLKSDQIEAAFSLTMIPSLFFECGFKVPVQEYKMTSGVLLKNDYSAALSARYNFGYFDLGASFDARFGGYRIAANGVKTEYPLNIQTYMVATYDFGSFTIGGDFALEYVAEEKGGIDMGAALWLNWQFALSSRLHIGVAAIFPSEFGGVKQDTRISFPIRMVYHF